MIVVGGDGMVHLGVNACAGTSTPLGVVATGTGNDAARSHGLSLAPLDAARSAAQALLDGRSRATDAARVICADGTRHWYLSVLSLGFDAVVSERANRMHWPKGKARYNLAVARELPVFRPPRYEVLLDGVPLDTRAMLVSIANGPAFGGGMRIAPDARTDDGLLDVVVLRPVPIPEFVQVFPSVFKGTHVRNRNISIHRARQVSVAVDRPIVAFADGERLGPSPVRCEVVPGALRLLVP